MVKLKRLNAVNLKVRDLSAPVAWYRRHFGFEPREEGRAGRAGLGIRWREGLGLPGAPGVAIEDRLGCPVGVKANEGNHQRPPVAGPMARSTATCSGVATLGPVPPGIPCHSSEKKYTAVWLRITARWPSVDSHPWQSVPGALQRNSSFPSVESQTAPTSFGSPRP